VSTLDPGKKKEIFCGTIADNIFYRSVKNAHFMVKESGYGIQMEVLQRLLIFGVDVIVITTKAGTTLKSRLSDWGKNGKVKDYGNGKQVFLSTKFMKSTR